MPWALGTAIFVIIWWTLLFTVLPFGVRSQQETDAIVPGTDPGAPAKPRLGMKLIVTTALAIVFWAIADWAYLHYYVQP